MRKALPRLAWPFRIKPGCGRLRRPTAHA